MSKQDMKIQDKKEEQEGTWKDKKRREDKRKMSLDKTGHEKTGNILKTRHGMKRQDRIWEGNTKQDKTG